VHYKISKRVNNNTYQVFIGMKLIHQLQHLIEQTDKYFVTPKVASDKLTAFISADEGVGGKAVLYTYDDAYYNDPPIEYDSKRYKKGKPGGTLTIGYGHTGEEAYEGNTITQKKALELLKKDLNTAIGCANRIIVQWIEDDRAGAKMGQCMYDAIVSLIFNSGCENVRTSTWIQDVKFGRWKDAYTSIKTWNPPQQRTKSGKWIDNYTRRNKEAELFYNCTY
jgi:GH24 family phage-related lysozyme (muramidase)